jgi:hypothetical protein
MDKGCMIILGNTTQWGLEPKLVVCSCQNLNYVPSLSFLKFRYLLWPSAIYNHTHILSYKEIISVECVTPYLWITLSFIVQIWFTIQQGSELAVTGKQQETALHWASWQDISVPPQRLQANAKFVFGNETDWRWLLPLSSSINTVLTRKAKVKVLPVLNDAMKTFEGVDMRV